MHIVFLTDEYPQPNVPHGGVGTFVQTIARELVKNNIEATVIRMNPAPINRDENDYGVKIYHIARSTVKGLKWFLNSRKIQKKLTQIHKIQPIDIIEGPEMSFSFIKKIPNVNQQKIDDILDKINSKGYQFLTEEEKDYLKRASKNL